MVPKYGQGVPAISIALKTLSSWQSTDTAATFIPIPYKARDNFNRSQFSSVSTVAPAIPRICVCIAALAPVVQTSWLLTITLGADAVDGVLSTVVVPDTVDDTVFVSASESCTVNVHENKINNSRVKYFTSFSFYHFTLSAQ